MMLNGLGLPKDQAGGAKLIIDSAPAVEEDTKALLVAGTLLFHGTGVKKNVVEAVRYYRLAADRKDPKGEQAINEVQAAAVAGLGADEAKRGFDCLQGNGVPKDEAKALALLKEAAEAGSIAATGMVGRMYFKGMGTKADPARGALYWHVAALLGSRPAKLDYGLARINGEGVVKDEADGLVWINNAAAHGDTGAHEVLGELYEKGAAGLPRDLARARAEYQSAAAAGSAFAKGALERLGK